jgi:hypothetical protein
MAKYLSSRMPNFISMGNLKKISIKVMMIQMRKKTKTLMKMEILYHHLKKSK